MKKRLRTVFRMVWRQIELILAALAAVVAGVLLFLSADTAAHWLLAVVSLILLYAPLRRIWLDVHSGHYGVELLAPLATVAAVWQRQYWTALALAVLMRLVYLLARHFENLTQRRLEELRRRAPTEATSFRGNKPNTVALAAVNNGDKLLLQPGDTVPVDVTVLEGDGDIDDRLLTGEETVRAVGAGDGIGSGAIVGAHALTVRVLHLPNDSRLQQTMRRLQSGLHSTAPSTKLARRFALAYVVMALAIAIAASFVNGSSRFTDVLAVATASPLLLSMPLAMRRAIAAASLDGVSIRSQAALEHMATLETLVLAKTGVLTADEFGLKKVVTFGDYSETDVLSMAASLEQQSDHPIARAIMHAAADRQLSSAKAKHISEEAGSGISARLRNRMVVIGRIDFIERHGVQLPKAFKPAAIDGSVVFVAADGELAGFMTFDDDLRPEAKTAIKLLKQTGIPTTALVTGDNAVVAQQIAKAAGVGSFEANLYPADRLRYIEQLPARPLAFVGQTPGDNPLFTTAEVGVAIVAPDGAALASPANIAILDGGLPVLARTTRLACRALRIGRQGLALGIIVDVLLMVAMATGKLPSVAGVGLQALLTLAVMYNTRRV